MTGVPTAFPLREEVGVLKDFIALLQKEQRILVSGDPEVLLPLSVEKNALAARLASFANQRALALATAGLTANREGMEQWLKKQPAENRAIWQAFVALAEEARALNDLNGKLITEKLSHNHQALATLTAASEHAAIYGPDGQARFSPGSGRSLGSA
ncbi:MAG: flagellar protein FlgN [Rhodocyclaceae bacterium]|nr:flagellar protein FlgN [Rhodocyclaceae bacterium]